MKNILRTAKFLTTCGLCQRIFDFFYGGGALLISHEKYIKDGKVLDHLWSIFNYVKGIAWAFN